MSILLDGTGGVTTPGVVNTAGETIATTLSVTGASTFTGTGKFATTIGVGNATPSASGSGITFPATQSASSDANTLDDYEEGTWTPSIGGTATYTSQTGKYTKIGTTVNIQGAITINVIGTGSIYAITGLPFTAAGTFTAWGTSYPASLNTNIYYLGCYIDPSTTNLPFFGQTIQQTKMDIPINVFKNGAQVQFSITYIANA